MRKLIAAPAPPDVLIGGAGASVRQGRGPWLTMTWIGAR
jgi:hypothetical protein